MMLSRTSSHFIAGSARLEDEPSIQLDFYRERNDKLTRNVVCASLTAALGSVGVGFVLAYPSPTLLSMQKTFDWSDGQMTWFSSLAFLGAVLGALITLYTMDKFGRKLNLMFCALPCVIGWSFIAGAKTTYLCYIGRFLTGIGLGAISLSVPLYVAEIAPAKYRGTLGNIPQMGIGAGFLFAYSFGAVINWRWLAILAIVPLAAMALMMVCFPETPRWLIMNGRLSDACTMLVFFSQKSRDECEKEAYQIQMTLEADGDKGMSLSDLKMAGVYKPFIISVFLMLFQQFSGINAVTSYASKILGEAGMHNVVVAENAITVVLFIGTAISCIIVDKLGRRILLTTTGSVMSVSMVMLGASRKLFEFPSSLTLFMLCLYIIGFGMGWGAGPWVVVTEILPSRVRGVTGSIVTQVNWLASFIVVKTFVSMEHSMQTYGCYWFYGGVCFFSVLFVAIFLPETKGKTLEEVEQLFKDKSVQNGLLDNERFAAKYGAV